MHSVNSERSAPLRKRTLSRGMSEDESLRHIIREVEETSRHLSRSDSRYGSLKRGQRTESLGEEDLPEKTEMVELRSDYEVCLQEVRALEVHQGALLFQVDFLQDALEGAEEMLSEAQRETHAVKMELEREREMRRKLEDVMTSLMQEIKDLKEERKSMSVTRPAKDQTRSSRDDVDASIFSGSSVDEERSDEKINTSSSSNSSFTDQLKHAGPVWLHGAPEGTSVDQESTQISQNNQRHMLHLKNMIEKHEAHDGDDNDESSGYEDAPSEFSPTLLTPDIQPDDEDLNINSNLSKNPDSCLLS